MSGERPLEGQAVVVTGAARGLGLAYAAAAAAAGASVLLNDIDTDELSAAVEFVRAAGGSAAAFAGSVADATTVAEMVAECVRRFGRLDGLVNNAALFPHGPALEATEKVWRSALEVNVLGAAFCATEVMRAMDGGGSIVNIVSDARAGVAGMSVYGSTKAALATLTGAWAAEMASLGISVNGIAPRAMTRMTVSFHGEGSGVERPAPELVAPLAVYLLAQRPDQMTGRIFRFDGHELFGEEVSGAGTALGRKDSWSVTELADAVGGGG